jgi:hypothetical protein
MTTAEASRIYRQRHPDRVKARNATPNSRAARARYEKSDKCVAYRNSYAEEYERKPERIQAKKLYRQSPKGKYLLRKASKQQDWKGLGFTETQYINWMRKQNGVCAICHEAPNGVYLCVDHCHITGEIRGLLCHACNVGIGKFSDDPNLLRRAIEYLER